MVWRGRGGGRTVLRSLVLCSAHLLLSFPGFLIGNSPFPPSTFDERRGLLFFTCFDYFLIFCFLPRLLCTTERCEMAVSVLFFLSDPLIFLASDFYFFLFLKKIALSWVIMGRVWAAMDDRPFSCCPFFSLCASVADGQRNPRTHDLTFQGFDLEPGARSPPPLTPISLSHALRVISLR